MTEETASTRIGRPDLSRITEHIYLSSLPRDEDVEHITALGIRLIISTKMFWPPKVYRRPPFRFVHCPSFDNPLLPIPQVMLRRGVTAALPVIEGGEGVLVHCRAGVHRSVAMTCCILIARGHSAEEAMRLVNEKREVADPYVPYIRRRIEIFEADWLERHGKPGSV